MNWFRVHTALLDTAGAFTTFAANWLLQSTLLIVAGLTIAWLARRRGAAVQSAIYRTTLAAAVVCPLATLVLSLNGVSGWSLPMPATREQELARTSTRAAAVSSPAVEVDDDFDGPTNVGWDNRLERSPPHHAESWHVAQPPSAVSPVGGMTSAPQPRAVVPPSTPAPRLAGDARGPSSFRIRPFGYVAIGIAVVWLFGSTLLLVRLTVLWRRLTRLLRAAVPADPAVQEASRQAAALVGVAAPKVLSSPYLSSPCVVGWPRRAVLLPEASPALPLRDVLIHELAHLRRRDTGWNLAARLIEALFFYQPLVWLLNRRMEASAEDVCDDFVVEFGGDRSQYARGLLEIAELSTTLVAAPAVAMVSLRSILARRVTRIMDGSRSLSTRAGNLLLALVIVGGLAGTLVVGFVGLGQHPSAKAQPPGNTASKEGTKEPSKGTADDEAKPPSVRTSSDTDDIVTVSGKVVDPDGKPFAGAKLYAVRWYWEPHIPHPPLAETTSDSDGRFTIAYRKSQFTVDVGRMDQWKEVSIVAAADGFGAGWVTWRDLPRGEEATLRLVTDDAPIAGRVVDLEGKSIAGVTVRVGSIHTGKGGNLDDWLAAVRRGEFPWTAVKHLDDDLPQFDGWPPPVVTGDDGRFQVNGLGRERRVDLSLAGPTIAYQDVEAVTRRSDIFPLKSSRSEQESEPVYGAEFELVAPPTQPITGIVRDAETRQPLAGVSIESNMFAGSNFINMRQLRAVSDEQGRYRLVGMPKGAGNRILAVPNDDQPYLMRDFKVPELRGLEPVEVDIELHRGIWITGRVTDLRTSKPLVSRLHYLPFWSNEYAQKTPEFGKPRTPDGFQDRYVSRTDGSYRLVGLPGRAIVGAECRLGHYRSGVGAESISGMNEHGHFKTYPNPVEPGKKWPNAMKEINPSPGAKEVVCNFALDPGEKVTVNVLDRVGKPVDGFETQGSGQSWSESRDIHGRFDVITLGPDETRTVVIRHNERSLGKVIRVKLADHPSRSLSVTLEPTARIAGRLLDRQGTPISGAAVEAWLKPVEDFGERLPTTTTDEKGHFEYNNVPSGCRYDLNATAAGLKPPGSFAGDVAVEPGETEDLGDVVYGGALKDDKDPKANETTKEKPAKAAAHAEQKASEPVGNTKANADNQNTDLKGVQVKAGEVKDLGDLVVGDDKSASDVADKKAAANKSRKKSDGRPATRGDRVDGNAATSGAHSLRGRVVDDKGQPVVGARMRMYRNYWLSPGGTAGAAPDPELLADRRADANGRFSAEFKPLSAAAESQVKSRGFSQSIGIFATAEGFGFGLRHAEATTKEVELRLVRDSSPVEGRLLDLEGRPVRGAQVAVRAVAVLDDEPRRLDDWLEEVRRSAAEKNDPSEIPNGAMIVEFDSFLAPFPNATTGDDGRFTIAGIGADRVAYLKVKGPKIASTWLPVVTRPIEALPLPTGLLRFAMQTCYGSHCDIVAVPEQPIRGAVRDAETGQPVEGAEVRFDWNDNGFSETGLAVKTDAEGHFQLSGLPKPSSDEQDVALARRRPPLRIVPASGQPYFRTEVSVPRGKGLDAVTCDVSLRRAVTLSGQITDRKTGQPVRAAVRYYPFLTNDEARGYPNFEAGVRKLGRDDRFATDVEGRFMIPALRGRGVLTVAAERGDRYTLADGAKAIADFMPSGQQQPNVYHLSGLNQDNAIREVDIPADAQQFSLDVRLAPLAVTRLLLVDEEGNDLSGVETQGLAPMNPFAGRWSNTWCEPLAMAWAELLGPDAGETREALFLDRAHNLGAMVRFASDDIGLRKTKRIVLHPCGSVRGRVVDGKGQPVAGAWVCGEVVARQSRSPAELRVDRITWRLTLNGAHADADGRFELKGVPPGAQYAIKAFAEKHSEMWRAVTAEIKPGTTVELGDVAPAAEAKQESAAGAPAAADDNYAPSADDKSGSDADNKQAAAKKTESADDDLVTVSGNVVDPQGKPLPGASVFVLNSYWPQYLPKPPIARATSDATGRFTIAFRKSQFDGVDMWKSATVAATADGFGPAWVTWRKLRPREQPTLRLATDDVPVTGRVVDLEGRPIAGVTVQVGSIDRPKPGELDPWLKAIGRGESRGTAERFIDDELPECDSFSPRAVTDDKGQFRLIGLGAERVAHLTLSGPDIAYSRMLVVTRRLPPVALDQSGSHDRREAVYGANFQFVALPARVIEGVVRAADTGLPMAGVAIGSDTFAGVNVSNDRALRTVTDDAGHYRLTGMPKGSGNRIVALPGHDQPYLMRELDVPDEPGLAPSRVDFALHRGIWITGRITDRATGKPLVARVHYLPFRANEFARRTPEFAETGNGHGDQYRYLSGADGRYRLLGLPGRAIVGTECLLGRYRRGVGAEAIAGINAEGNFDTFHNPGHPGKKWPHAMKEINPAPDAHSVVCDLELDPGQTMTVKVVDPAGKPIVGFTVDGRTPAGEAPVPAESSEVEIVGLSDDEVRTLVIQHGPRRLAKVVRLRLAEHPERKTTVMLQATGKITGRLLDRKGNLLIGASITAFVHPLEDFAKTLPATTTDGRGRFEYIDVPTGCTYDLDAEVADVNDPGWFAENLAVGSGETKDLGDVVYGNVVESNQQGPAKLKSADKAGDNMPEQQKTVRGRVLLPDGKPAAGAHLALIGTRSAVGRSSDLEWGHEVLAEATTDENGEYALRMRNVSQQTHTYPRVIVRHDGSAIAWRRDINLDAAETQVNFELKPEEPLRGRLVDLEGRPAAGVRISIASVVKRSEKEEQEHGVGYRPREPVPAAWIGPITSDEHGRFVVHGLTANHGVTLQVQGDDRFALQDIAVNTDQPEERSEHDGTYRPLVKNAKPGEEVLLALAPAQVFEGTVRYADTGEAVPQARVSIWASDQEHGSMISEAGSADEQGHYRITPWTGIRFGLTAYPPAGMPYLVRQTPLEKAIRWEGGERVKKIDMTLPRGVLVLGTVVEQGTGAPVAGAAVQYHPESSNNRNETDDILTGWQCIEVTDQRGRFTIAVLPGPGRLLVHGPQGKYVLHEIGGRELSSGKPGGTRYYAHAVARLNPEAGQDAVEVKCELQPGATVTGRIVDEAGKAIDEALVISRLNISPYSLFWRGHTTPTLGGRFELTGLAEGVEYPVYFLDPKRRLGATEVIKAGDKERTIVLKPCGTATLRLVDDKGEPMPANYGFVELVVTPGSYRGDRDALERGELAADADFVVNIDRLNNPFPSGDENGTRSLKALIPGATYRVIAKRDGEIKIVKEFQVKPNESVDFGDITVER